MKHRMLRAAAEVVMRFTNVGEGPNLRQAGISQLLGLLMSAPVWAAAPAAAPGAAPAAAPTVAGTPGPAAVWTPKEFTFVYQGFTTNFTCDALQRKMKEVLLQLGARPDDLQVRRYGCTQTTGPDPFAGVQVKMTVLEPAASAATPAVAAQWKEVDLVTNPDPMRAAAECDLYDQIGKKVLPYFTAREVRQETTCEYRRAVPGSTQLRAEMLVPGEAPQAPASTAAR